ncbi:poly-beta-hydroxybutyrate-responsive repressor [Bacillus kexueae]|uniref:poly-beta-hydroxybutyrate-responsive repressor n=1 Tax=Aeribacillus kexueae TaxID=2078952 RepID=UPI001FAF25EA|nr:poly-beta-hydroxybutyrate-responsive repressor [Bacillus kexueae]
MSTNRNEDALKNKITTSQKNFVIPVLLLLLRNWSTHGYDLMQRLSHFGFQTIDQGNLYRILRQLEKEELVTSSWDTSDGGPAKRVYSITDAGLDYLDLWATSLENYQNMLDQFFQMYTSMFTTSTNNEKKPKE